jgi:uncharacterized protein
MLARLLRRWTQLVYQHRLLVLLVSALVAAGCLWLSLRLPILTDTSVLLPPSARSVIDLRAIEKRVRAAGTILVVVKAETVAAREKAAAALRERLATVPTELVTEVVDDDRGARKWLWENRFLFVPLADLVKARDALARRIQAAKLAANPAYVDFEDEPATPAKDQELEELKQKWRDAEKRAAESTAILAKDGLSQLFVVRCPSSAAEVARGKRSYLAVKERVDAVLREHPGVEIGITGDIVTAVTEQKAILSGMVKATLVTIVVVAIGLLLYFRSLSAVAALLVALGVGVMLTFGITRLVVGHLNSVSAFLAAIVVGVGIDFGIILLARWFEELRAGRTGAEALATALEGSAGGTFAAAAAAGVAYASLIATDFRGFREFGVIGGVGMLACWLASYTTLPALLAVIDARKPLRPEREPAIGRVLGRLLPRSRLSKVWIGSLAVTLAAGVLTWKYLHTDPFEYNWEKIRSMGADAREARKWTRIADQAFGRGISGAFVVAAPSRQAVAEIARKLRAVDAGVPVEQRTFDAVRTLDDLVPVEQAEKLTVIEDVRKLLADDALEALDDAERQELDRFRPPADLRLLGEDDVPERLASLFTEKDGTRGKFLYANYGLGVAHWNGKALEVFVEQIKRLDLPEGTLLGGTAFVFTDIQRAVRTDGMHATLIAIAGVALLVLLLVGFNRHALVTLVCVLSGTLLMVAGADLLGLKVNFLDFAALPLTLGIGVDYSVNIALRHRHDLARGDTTSGTRSLRALVTTGGAVVLCSFTTIVGYGSLMLSENSGIRSFGIAATLGELTCVVTAVTLGPALLWLLFRETPGTPAP